MSSLNILDVRPLSDLQGFFLSIFFLSLKNNFIYLSILATLGLCYAGFSLVVVPRLLTAVTSLAVEHGLEGARLQ